VNLLFGKCDRCGKKTILCHLYKMTSGKHFCSRCVCVKACKRMKDTYPDCSGCGGLPPF
jgi:hypothetical protein